MTKKTIFKAFLSGLFLVAFLFNTIQNTNIINTKAQYDDGYDSSFNSSFEVAQENYQDDYTYPYQTTAFNDTFVDITPNENDYLETQYQDKFNQNDSQVYDQTSSCDYEYDYSCEDSGFMIKNSDLAYTENDQTNLATNTTDSCYDSDGNESTDCVAYESSNSNFDDYSETLKDECVKDGVQYGNIIGGTRNGGCSTCKDQYHSYFSESENMYRCTKPKTTQNSYNSNQQYNTASNEDYNQVSDINTNNCGDSSSVTKIVVTLSSHNLTGLNCGGQSVMSFDIGYGKPSTPTPLVTDLPRTKSMNVIDCNGGSCSGADRKSAYVCDDFVRQVTSYAINFYNSNTGCASIHGFFLLSVNGNYSVSGGCIRVNDSDITMLVRALTEEFTVTVQN